MVTPMAAIAVKIGLDNANAFIEAPSPLNAFSSPNVEAVAPAWEAVRAFVAITSSISASVNPFAVSMAFICSALNDDCAIAALIADTE